MFLITSRLNIRTSLRLGICIVCYVLPIPFVKSGNNLVEFKKKAGNAWSFHLILLYLQQVFEEMQYSQGLHGTDETTKRTEK